MRCKACNTALEQFEIDRKCKLTGEYLDLCSPCASVSNEAIHQQEEPIYRNYIDMQEEAEFIEHGLVL